MKSEVKLKNKELMNRVVCFGDLKNGEGTIDLEEHLRLRLSDFDYIHFSVSGETEGVDDKSNWPPGLTTEQPLREFKLIAEEI